MITDFTVENYRGLGHIELTGLTRFSLITGPNNFGKTSILEALMLLSNGPNTPFKAFEFELLRGLQPPALNPGIAFNTATIYPGMWLGAFKDFDTSKPIFISGVTADGHSRSIKVTRSQSDSFTQVEINPGTSSDSSQQFRSVSVEMIEDDGPPHFWVHTNIGSGAVQTDQQLPAPWPGVFVSTHNPTPKEMIRNFTEVVNAGLKDSLLETVQIVDPRVKDVQSLDYNDSSTLHVTFVGSKRPIPIHLAGGATASLINLLTSLQRVRGGIFCVDEIFAGIHFSHLEKIMKSLVESATELDVQIVATTHSMETIVAASEATTGTDELSVFQLRDTKKGIHAYRYEAKAIEAANAFDQDLR